MYRHSPTDSTVKTSALGGFSDGGQSAVLLTLSYPDSLAERETWSEATEQLELREVRTRAEPHRSPLLFYNWLLFQALCFHQATIKPETWASLILGFPSPLLLISNCQVLLTPSP